MALKVCAECGKEQKKKFSSKCEFCGAYLLSQKNIVETNIEDTSYEKKCPFCAEIIKTEARKCKHCGEMLDEKPPQEQFFAPASAMNQKETTTKAQQTSWLGIIILLIVAGIAGVLMLDAKGELNWPKTTETLQNEVKSSLQKKMREDTKTAGIKIIEVTLIHKNGNEYDGLVEAKLSGKTGKFGIKVTYDGKNLMWETQRGYLLSFM
jgi:uncharacterized membrane protein YvbJ